jgi:hypothetical protein
MTFVVSVKCVLAPSPRSPLSADSLSSPLFFPFLSASLPSKPSKGYGKDEFGGGTLMVFLIVRHKRWVGIFSPLRALPLVSQAVVFIFFRVDPL